MFKHTINVNNNLKLSTQCRNLLNATETKQFGLKQRTKRLGLKQRKITRLLYMHIDKNIINGVLLQKKNMEDVLVPLPLLLPGR